MEDVSRKQIWLSYEQKCDLVYAFVTLLWFIETAVYQLYACQPVYSNSDIITVWIGGFWLELHILRYTCTYIKLAGT